ncbi:hypothetical protein [Pseudonocardia zijingensis]|uniref:hypothetical protein n=1 Tax=Pseudonocardia zijingensis TaxID=153376 RepID=UPI00360B9D5D
MLGHGVGGVALQAAQVAAHARIELGRGDVLAQGRLGHPRRGRCLGTLAALTATSAISAGGPPPLAPGAVVRPAARPVVVTAPVATARGARVALVRPRLRPLVVTSLLAAEPLTGPAASLLVVTTLVAPVPLAGAAPRLLVVTTLVAPVPLTGAAPRLLVAATAPIPARSRAPVARPLPGPVVVPAPLAAGTPAPVAPRPLVALSAAVAAGALVITSPVSRTPAPLVATVTPRPPLTGRTTAPVAFAVAAIRAPSAVRAAGAFLARAALPAEAAAVPVTTPVLAPVTTPVAAPITVPAGTDAGRAAPATTLVGPPATRRSTALTVFTIIGSAAAVAIFSRAVIAGTIRDTHL